MADREGFEPSVRFGRTHDFQSCTFGQLGHLSAYWSSMLARCAVMQQLRSIQQLIRTHKREIFLFTSIIEIFVCLHTGRGGFRTRRAGYRRCRRSVNNGSRKRAMRYG